MALGGTSFINKGKSLIIPLTLCLKSFEFECGICCEIVLLRCKSKEMKSCFESRRKLTKEINMDMKKLISLTNYFDSFCQHFSNAISPIPSRPSDDKENFG